MPFIRAKSSLSSQEKEQLSPLPQSLEQGYFGVGKEIIQGWGYIKENI